VDLQLGSKRALVTGASRGIGKAIAMELAREGASVVICSRNREQIEATTSEIAAETGATVVGFVADTSDGDAIKRLVADCVGTLGGLDILVNNAARVSGGATPDSLLGGTDELLRGDFETKMLGYVRCAREAAPHMLTAGWGRIINVSGMAARGGGSVSAGMRNISLVSLSSSLAQELGPHGVSVNTVLPGAVLTEDRPARLRALAERQGTTAEVLDRTDAQRNAIKRVVSAAEIGAVVAFLCSPLSQAVTGEAISVGGGGSRAIVY